MRDDGKVTCGGCGAVVPREGATLVTRSVTTATLPGGWPDGYTSSGSTLQQASTPLCQRCLSNALARQGELVAEAQQTVLLERERLAKGAAA